ncbi:MAG: acylphosphatase [Anaerolineales bacterium]|nr:acylphosphatase [Anaerolineales bacterium]MDW8447791.1 acylphosphatase [Anaerolineales bacterium]
MTESAPKRLHAIVEGVVQGVGFRMFVVRLATELNLTGWVRNTWDGNVEVVAEGEEAQLNKLLAGLKVGPRAAHVTNVRTEWLQATGEFRDFRIRYTV